MIATTVVRTLGVSAASGLVRRDGRFHVAADDENTLYVFDLDGLEQRLVLLEGELPADKPARKARKPDFEILLDVPGRGLLAIGSGSRSNRERAVLLEGGAVQVIDTAPLCAACRTLFPELNLEGAALLHDEIAFLQRASRKDPRNALLLLPRDDLLRALDTRRFAPLRAPRVVRLDFGDDDGLPWAGTDLARLDDGDLLASLVLEDACDAYEDGACRGAALARFAPDGTLRWQQPLGTPAKIEGLAVAGDTLWMVGDADDRAVPAQLLRATLPRR